MALRAAVVQLNSGGDVDRNLEAGERLVRAAAADGAGLVVLPEKWNLLAGGGELLAGAEGRDGPSLTAARSWARELDIHLVAGSICMRAGEGATNTTVVIGPDGADLAVYSKIHMFDVEAGGVTYAESAYESAGEEIVAADVGGLGLGLAICYDVRFPELFRILSLRGADAFALPSAFTAATGRDHWDVLVRARAIENQAFVLAADQVGAAAPNFESYGHSAIVDPWGRVLAGVAEGEGFAAADLDLAEMERIRERLPALRHRRPEAYRWPSGVRS